MNEFLIGQKCRYAGMDVTVRSVRAPDGRYVVEDSEGVFFPAHHNGLTAAGVDREFADHSMPFQSICSRAAMFKKKRKQNV